MRVKTKFNIGDLVENKYGKRFTINRIQINVEEEDDSIFYFTPLDSEGIQDGYEETDLELISSA